MQEKPVEVGIAESAASDRTQRLTELTPLSIGSTRVLVGDREITMSAGTLGRFSRIPVPANAVVDVDADFPGVAIGDQIHIQAEDGGRIVERVENGRATTDTDGRVKFRFQVSDMPGIHRVTLRSGGEHRVLEFWVGPEQTAFVRN